MATAGCWVKPLVSLRVERKVRRVRGEVNLSFGEVNRREGEAGTVDD